MSRWAPCKRRDFIAKLRNLEFECPEVGTKHEFMLLATCKQVIPSNKEYSVPKLKKLLRQVKQKLGREITLNT